MNNPSAKLITYIFGFYLGISPIYWIPFIPVNVIFVLKLSLLGLVAFASFLSVISARRIIFPGGAKLFFLMAIFIVLTLLGFYKGNLEDSIYASQTAILIFSFILITSNLINKISPYKIIKVSVSTFTFLSICSLGFMYLNPDFQSPLNEQLSIINTGFGGSRNSWSPAISFFIPYVISSGLFSKRFLIFSFIALFANQVLVVGRSGILATISSSVIKVLADKSLIKILLYSSIVFVFAILISQNLDYFRLTGDVSSLSSGRDIVFIDAMKSIATNFFTGIGFGNRISYESDLIIHIEIIRMVFENGIFYGLAGLLIVLFGLSAGWKKFRSGENISKSAFLCLISGIVVGLFEPFVVFGNFYNSSLWWFSFCIVVSNKKWD